MYLFSATVFCLAFAIDRFLRYTADGHTMITQRGYWPSLIVLLTSALGGGLLLWHVLHVLITVLLTAGSSVSALFFTSKPPVTVTPIQWKCLECYQLP